MCSLLTIFSIIISAHRLLRFFHFFFFQQTKLRPSVPYYPAQILSNSKLFQLAKESKERNNIKHKNYLLNCQRNQIENFFVIIEFTIEITTPFRKGNQETVEETMEEFHKPKKMDIYIYIYNKSNIVGTIPGSTASTQNLDCFQGFAFLPTNPKK